MMDLKRAERDVLILKLITFLLKISASLKRTKIIITIQNIPHI